MPREPGYRIISGDGYLELPPERWTKYLPAKYQEPAPRTVKMPDGGDGLAVGDGDPEPLGASVTGKPYEEHKNYGVVYEGSPGCGSPEQRLEEQYVDGIDAEVLFPSNTMNRLWKSVKGGPDAYKAMFRAWNRFLAEEYCVVAPDRLIGMGLVPDTSVDDAIEELEYCTKAGLKGVDLQAFPNGKGFPLPADDRFWAAAVSAGMPITTHSSLGRGQGPVFQYPRQPERVGGGGGDPVAHMSRFAGQHIRNPAQLVWAGVFDRFPALRLYFAETQIGWLPYAIEQFDNTYDRSVHWAEREYGLEPLERRPSEYVREHFYWGFIYDPIGARLHCEVGADRTMWGSDFPHLSGDYPYSRQAMDQTFAQVPDEMKRRMLNANAVEFFNLEPDS